MRLLLIGFGNVGKQLARILLAGQERFPGLDGSDFQVVGITTGRHGALANPGGLDLGAALLHGDQGGCFDPDCPDYCGLSSLEAARTLEYDVLVELSPLTIRKRGEPAVSHCREALRRGRHVVTANKGPAAFARQELQRLAAVQECAFLHEAAVMDGAPVFSLARFGLRGCRILELDGVLNSTTNFVLSRMEVGIPLEESVRAAQDLGFAEADPNLDLEGWDSAAKISVLANALLDANINPLDVEREGILSVTAKDVESQAREGKRVKLICRAWREGDRVRARVGPEPVSVTHPFAGVAGPGSVLRFHTDLMGPILVIQESPTLSDTAYGVLNDLLLIRESVI